MAELQSEDSDKIPVNATIACKNRRGKFITSKKWKTNSEKLSVMKKSREMYKAKRKFTYKMAKTVQVSRRQQVTLYLDRKTSAGRGIKRLICKFLFAIIIFKLFPR